MRLEDNLMAWKQLEYSKNQVDKAGWKVIDENCSEPEYKEALKVIDNWRAAHGYPLYVISKKLRAIVDKSKSSLVVHRLKRLDSITAKLKRNEHMSLRNMQDIGGCRVVVPKVEDVYRVANEYEKSRIRHEKIGEGKDYIANPKADGYRCLHHIYKYKSDDKENPYNGMKIEIQFRTLLQHLWATAVETMGLCTNTNLKAGIGDEGHKRFFALVSSLFAMHEGTPIVPNTPNDLYELLLEIKKLDEQCHIINKLKAISRTANLPKAQKIKNGYFILELDLQTAFLLVRHFEPNRFKSAVQTYDNLEAKRCETKDVVLVSASDTNSLRKAYPNYFGDIKAFITIFEEIFEQMSNDVNILLMKI